MLEVLRIKNLAVIENVEIEFSPGLNVLTGETGAGKSVVLKALELITGSRASTDIIRTKEEKCSVEALISLKNKFSESLKAKDEIFDDIELGDEILIKRHVDRKSKSRILINGSLETANNLQKITSYIFDITAQHAQQKLLDNQHQLELLDSFGLKAQLLEDYQEAFSNFKAAKAELDNFLKNKNNIKDYIERISLEAKELSEASIEENERQITEEKLEILSNSENLIKYCNLALSILAEDSENSVDAGFSQALKEIDKAHSLDQRLSNVFEIANSIQDQLAELQFQLNNYINSLEIDPEQIELLRERIALIAKLERKYKKDGNELIAYLSKISKELSSHDDGEFSEVKLYKKLEESTKVLKEKADIISKERKKLATKLSSEIENELKSLEMKHARFSVEITQKDFKNDGCDEIEFMFSANKGEDFKALSKVASGGELSRVLLVIKKVLSESSEFATLIFDEVDSGISGAVAQIVGEKLKALAQNFQVIVVTHSPQIAAFADRQFLIKKETIGPRTYTNIEKLSEEKRVQQIASMLAGKDVAPEFVKSAKKLREDALR